MVRSRPALPVSEDPKAALNALSFNFAICLPWLSQFRRYISMQSKKFTRAVIWFVVIAMVLSLIVAAAAAIV